MPANSPYFRFSKSPIRDLKWSFVLGRKASGEEEGEQAAGRHRLEQGFLSTLQ